MLPDAGFVRLSQIIGDKKKGIPPVIPVCAATWWNGVKSGRFPQGVLIGPNARAWRVEDIRALITEMGAL